MTKCAAPPPLTTLNPENLLNLFNLLNGGGPILRAAHAVHLTALSFLPARPDFLYNEDKEQGTQNS